jgi:hypothetical protein
MKTNDPVSFLHRARDWIATDKAVAATVLGLGFLAGLLLAGQLGPG